MLLIRSLDLLRPSVADHRVPAVEFGRSSFNVSALMNRFDPNALCRLGLLRLAC